MHRSEDLKMPTIDGEDLCDIQPLGHCDDAGVDKIDIGVVVFAEYFGGANVVIVIRRDKNKLAFR